MTTRPRPQALSAKDKVDLLNEVQDLLGSLRAAPVYPVESAGTRFAAPVATGVPTSAMGNVVAFLHRHRNPETLRAFVLRLDQLDGLTAQNERNPRAHHAALKEILLPWLDEQKTLDADALLYRLAWVRRLLPASSSKLASGKSPGKGSGMSSMKPPRPRKPIVTEEAQTFKPAKPIGGNQMQQKLLEALAKKERKS